ncbi:hypothetical protein [Stutzerimonas nitrititolerans]|uniref:hypothetical protein n=1 Tax=Stutzerimonas nitrititolerans TaxID=2482751 RepID=UPI000A4AD498|nr:hypothetical protein [Stutzerimonas nitrititolerans]
MAIVVGGEERLLLNYPKLNLSQVKFVGWGAGQYFKAYYPFLKNELKLEYTVCPATGEQYGSVLGVDVRPPSVLLSESLENTVVVIFAAQFFDVMHALRDQFGNFKAVRAFETIALDDKSASTLNEIQDFWRIQPSLAYQWSLTKRPRFGIFVQGLASAHTPYALAWNRLRYPNAYQCMVTWEDQPPGLLDECARWLDKLILVPQPENKGYLYLNSVLRSCRLGAQHLSEQGIEYAVRTRSDSVLSGSVCQVIDLYFSGGRNKGKIAAPVSQGWWHHLPFMFNEKVMVGWTEDLLGFWSMAEDMRPNDHQDFCVEGQENFLELRRAVPESLLWESYASRLDLPTKTLEDSYRFAREYILPLEPMLCGVSLKFAPLFSIYANRNFGSSIDDWERVALLSGLSLDYASSLDVLDMTVDDFWAHRVG